MKTQQRSLFDTAGAADPPVSTKFLSRRDDPISSQVSAERAVTSGQVKGDAETIVEVLREARTRDLRIPGSRGSLTAKEIAKAAGWITYDKHGKPIPDNVRVSRRMAALEVEQHDKEGKLLRPIMVVVTGLRRSFDNEKEQAITCYALADACCGKQENWDDYGNGDRYITRVCQVCNEALGIAEVRS